MTRRLALLNARRRRALTRAETALGVLLVFLVTTAAAAVAAQAPDASPFTAWGHTFSLTDFVAIGAISLQVLWAYRDLGDLKKRVQALEDLLNAAFPRQLPERDPRHESRR